MVEDINALQTSTDANLQLTGLLHLALPDLHCIDVWKTGVIFPTMRANR